MENGTMATLLAALKLDEHPLVNQFMYIEEHNNADGSFVLSSVIKHQTEQNQNVIFIVCHNSVGHFRAISQKLGYNLNLLEQSGKVHFVDVLDKIQEKNFLLSEEPYHSLYCDIKGQLDVWGSEKSVCIVVENLGNLIMCGIQGCLTFINYLRAIACKRKGSSVVLSMHNFPECPEFNFVMRSIRYFSDITVVLKDLQTGRANDVTGHLKVTRLGENFKKSEAEYQYQLLDKRINVFTPGLRSFI